MWRFLIMYYQEEVINGILCCKHSPNGEWIKLSKQSLTERLMKYNKALQIIQNFDEEDEGKYGDSGVVDSNFTCGMHKEQRKEKCKEQCMWCKCEY